MSPNVAWSNSLESYHPYLHPKKVLKIPKIVCIHSTLHKITKSRFGRLGNLGVNKFHCTMVINTKLVIRIKYLGIFHKHLIHLKPKLVELFCCLILNA